MALVIESNIPIPPRGDGSRETYPFSKMAVGDSFFAPGATTQKLAGSFSTQRRRYGRKFSVRTLTENGVKGVRVWRVA
jgi:hypothetical protein